MTTLTSDKEESMEYRAVPVTYIPAEDGGDGDWKRDFAEGEEPECYSIESRVEDAEWYVVADAKEKVVADIIVNLLREYGTIPSGVQTSQ